MHKLELVEVDGLLGLALPGDALDRLRLGLGDAVFLTERDGSLYLTPAARTNDAVDDMRPSSPPT